MTFTNFLLLLGNHLWQSTLLVLAAGLLTLALRKNQARTRYWVWWIASLKFLIPFSLLVSVGSLFSWRTAPATTFVEPSVSTFVMEQVAQPFSTGASELPSFIGLGAKVEEPSLVWAALLIGTWLLGSSLMLARWWIRWRKARGDRLIRLVAGRELETLRRLEERIGMRSTLPIVVSSEAVEPSVHGSFQPVLVWPVGLSERLGNEELEAILLHELAHVRYRDNLTMAIHMVVQTIFWFHPLMWRIGGRLVDEREKACDEDVLRWGGASHLYAEGILKVCEFCLASPLACVSGITGSNLKRRIENIVNHRISPRLSWRAALLLVLAAITVSAGPIALGVVRINPIAASPVLAEQTVEKSAFIRQLPASGPELPSAPIPVARVEPPPQQRPPVSPGPREVSPSFEVISIRPSSGAAPVAGARGGPGQRGGGPAGPTPCGGFVQINPGRFTATNVTLYRLINLAAGRICRLSTEQNLVSGLPDWSQTVAFDIQATIPAGSPAYTQQQFLDGDAPQLQMMIQNLLADRFKLALHREMKETPIYNLVMVKMGRITVSDDQTPPPPPSPPTGPPTPGQPPPLLRGTLNVGVDPPAGIVRIRASAIPISRLIGFIQGGVGRVVVDKTELKGLYDIPEVNLNVGPYEITPGAVTVWPEIMLQLGLRMDATKGPVEILVIDRAERPSEN